MQNYDGVYNFKLAVMSKYVLLDAIKIHSPAEHIHMCSCMHTKKCTGMHPQQQDYNDITATLRSYILYACFTYCKIYAHVL